MEKAAITTHEELQAHIAELRATLDVQGMALNNHFSEFVQSISPFEAVKSSIHELVADKEVQFDLVKGGLNLGANFLIERIFNRNHDVKGFLSSTVIEKVSSSFIQANAASIMVGITKLFSKKQPAEDDSDEVCD